MFSKLSSFSCFFHWTNELLISQSQQEDVNKKTKIVTMTVIECFAEIQSYVALCLGSPWNCCTNDSRLSVDIEAWIFFLSPFQYIVLLILVFLFELSAGTLAYIYERNVSDELNMTLSETFVQNYAVSERHTKAIDLMQQKFVCCGAIRFEDYRESVWLKSRRKDLIRSVAGRIVPDSCCVTFSEGCGTSDHPSNIPYTVSAE